MLIVLAVALLLFGGTRLAGLGKGTGRAIREFKEETRGMREAERAAKEGQDTTTTGATTPTRPSTTVEADVVDDKPHQV